MVVIKSTQAEDFDLETDLSARFMVTAGDGSIGLDFRRDDAGNRIRWLMDISGSSGDLYLCILSTIGGGEQCSSAVTVQLPGEETEVEASIALVNSVITATIQFNGGLIHTANFPLSYFEARGALALMMSPEMLQQSVTELILFNSGGEFAVSLFPCLTDTRFNQLYATYVGDGTPPSRDVGQNARCAS